MRGGPHFSFLVCDVPIFPPFLLLYLYLDVRTRLPESKAPDGTLQQFLSGENRYASLEKMFPDESKKLREKIEKEYTERYDILKAMAGPVPDEGKEKAEDKEE